MEMRPSLVIRLVASSSITNNGHEALRQQNSNCERREDSEEASSSRSHVSRSHPYALRERKQHNSQ